MPFFWITSLLIAGIITANKISGTGWVWYLATLLAALFGFGLLYLKVHTGSSPDWMHSLTKTIPGTRLSYLLLPFFFALGASFYHFQQPLANGQTIFGYNNQGQKLLIQGFVLEPPDKREKLMLVKLQADAFVMEEGTPKKSHEKIMVFLPADAQVALGDILSLSGKPITPQEDADFSYRQYLAAENIFSQLLYPKVVDVHPGPLRLSHFLFRFREKSLSLLAQIFPAPESALAQGILLGDESAIPGDLDAAFRQSGTSHLIAISGFNIAIVASLITMLFAGLLGRWRGTAAAIITIGLYTILVGANPPVVRAAIMGSLSMMGALIGRRNGGINALFLTAGIMLACQPYLLWSISFQLSAAATLGLILFASPIQKRLKGLFADRMEESLAQKVSSGLGEYFFYTIAAQITTLPILLHHFHQFPWVTLLANPLVLPLQPPLMITAGAALILAWVHPLLGHLAALSSLPFITLTIKVVTWAGGLKFPSLTMPQVGYSLILIWLILLCIPPVLPKLVEKVKIVWKPTFAIAIILAAAYGVLHVAIDRPDGHLHIYFSGNTKDPVILMVSPYGETVLISPGNSLNELYAFIDPRLPFPGRHLDGLIWLEGTTRQDDLTAMATVLSPAEIYLTGKQEPAIPLDLNSVGTIRQLPDGGVLDFSDGLTLKVLPSITGGGGTANITWQNLQMKMDWGQGNSLIECDGNLLYTGNPKVNLPPSCRPQVWISADSTGDGQPDIILSRSGWLHLESDGSQIWLESEK